MGARRRSQSTPPYSSSSAMSPSGYPSAWLRPRRASFRFTRQNHLTLRGLRTSKFSLLARRFQLPIPCRQDLLLPSGQHVRRRDIADGAVQPHRVVVVDVLGNEPPRVVLRQRCTRPDAFSFQRFVPTLDLAVGLRVERRRFDVRHTRDSDELLEIPRDELRPVVGDDPRFCLGVFFLGSLQYDFDLSLGHRLTQIPVYDRPAIAIQHAAQIVKRAANVDVGNVDMPMSMGFQWMFKPGSFL